MTGDSAHRRDRAEVVEVGPGDSHVQVMSTMMMTSINLCDNIARRRDGIVEIEAWKDHARLHFQETMSCASPRGSCLSR